MIASTRSELPRGERRLIVAAFLSLFGILAAQSLLETARDALFLAHAPIARLPWMYLAMAVVTLLVARIPYAAGGSARGRGLSVALSLAIGSAVTTGLAAALPRAGMVAVYALFLWSGVFSAGAVTQVWTVVGERLDLSLAKRLYGRLAAGGGLGAVAGAAVARLLSHRFEARHLVLLAAALLAATAIGPARALRARFASAPAQVARGRVARRRRSRLLEHPYVTRLLLAALLAAAVSTLIDFSFKQAIAARLPADRLPAFFATFYLVTSALGLLLQLFGVGWLVRAAGVARAPLLLPLLLLGGLAWTIVTGGLGALLMLRGLDSALRGALFRPSLELLQAPLGRRLRRKAKPLIDAVGQRGGQALAALALLLPFGVAAAPGLRMALATALLLTWAAIALGLARRYVDLLRVTLLAPDRPAPQAAGSFALDGAARVTLIAALDSPREAEVAAALDLLGANGQQHLIPLRLLDHPSPAIVRLAVQLLTSQPTREGRPGEIQRAGLLAALDGLLDHPSLAVRATALLRRTALAPDLLALTAAAHHAACPVVRGIALAASVARGWIDDAGGVPALRVLVAHGSAQVRLAVAEAIADRPSPRVLAVLQDLGAAREAEVLGPVATALGALGGTAAIAMLITLLGRRESRAPARAALARAPGGAFELAADALSDVERPLPVRANLPRALVEIDPERAAPVLLDGLLIEDDGFVRYRILRALNRVRRARPETALDGDILGRAAVAAVESAYRYLAWRLFLDDGASRLGARRTPTWELLRELLREKEANAVERLFRVLALRYPGDDFRRLLRTLRAGDRRARAAGRELIDNLLHGPAHTLTLALVDDVGDRERLAAIAGGTLPRAPTYRDLLAEIRSEEQGGTLSALAAHHAAELEAAAPAIDADDRIASARGAHA